MLWANGLQNRAAFTDDSTPCEAGALMDASRRTLAQVLIVLTVLFGLDVFTGNEAQAGQACDQIRTACKNAGFVLGGGARDGLLLDCVNPIVQGTAQPKSASRPLPTINPQLVNACREEEGLSARRAACERTAGARRRRSDRLRSQSERHLARRRQSSRQANIRSFKHQQEMARWTMRRRSDGSTR